MLKTEIPDDRHPDLDQYVDVDLVDAFVSDQVQAVEAVRAQRGRIAAAVAAAVPRLRAGGRLVYVGAGTSGRLGVLDSVELFPTFSWPRWRAVPVLAGGLAAMFESIEGAEDDIERGRADLRALEPKATDCVILLAASGCTPYVLGALEAARAAGALTVGISNNPGSELARDAEIGITLDTGSEVISGSTRLKAGTAQKIALNTLSSAIMVRLHKVYGNLMVDMQPTNDKLLRRAVRLTMRATGVDEALARGALEACDYQVKVAIVALARGMAVREAEARLAAVQGNVRRALEAA